MDKDLLEVLRLKAMLQEDVANVKAAAQERGQWEAMYVALEAEIGILRARQQQVARVLLGYNVLEAEVEATLKELQQAEKVIAQAMEQESCLSEVDLEWKVMRRSM